MRPRPPSAREVLEQLEQPEEIPLGARNEARVGRVGRAFERGMPRQAMNDERHEHDRHDGDVARRLGRIERNGGPLCGRTGPEIP